MLDVSPSKLGRDRQKQTNRHANEESGPAMGRGTQTGKEPIAYEAARRWSQVKMDDTLYYFISQ